MSQKLPAIRKSEVLYETDRFQLVRDELEFSNGWKQEWQYAVSKGYAVIKICALTDKNELILVREYRGAVRKFVLRTPAGYVEANENPNDAAGRELEEETGWRAGELVLLGTETPTDGSYRKLPAYVFLARNLESGTLNREPSEEDMEVEYIPFERALEMAMNLEIEDSETLRSIIAVHKYLQTNV